MRVASRGQYTSYRHAETGPRHLVQKTARQGAKTAGLPFATLAKHENRLRACASQTGLSEETKSRLEALRMERTGWKWAVSGAGALEFLEDEKMRCARSVREVLWKLLK